MSRSVADLLEIVVVIILYPSMFVASGCGIAAPVLLLGRIVVFLKSGEWLNSACDLTSKLLAVGFDVPDACAPIATGWLGVDYLYAWLLQNLDVSLLSLIVALGIPTAFFLVMIVAMIVLRGVKSAIQ